MGYFWDLTVHGEVDHWLGPVTYVATPRPPSSLEVYTNDFTRSSGPEMKRHIRRPVVLRQKVSSGDFFTCGRF